MLQISSLSSTSRSLSKSIQKAGIIDACDFAISGPVTCRSPSIGVGAYSCISPPPSTSTSPMQSQLPARQRLQRVANRIKASQPSQYFLQFKLRAQNVVTPNDLLPGLNDILDAFEAMPIDLAKYFTLLKEIDAKCITTVPRLNRQIDEYVDLLHAEEVPHQDELDMKASAVGANGKSNPSDQSGPKEKESNGTSESPDDDKRRRLKRIMKCFNDVIPCLEEKMHVTSVAADVLAKHLYRIDNDYRVIVGNNEIPELVRIGPLNHRAIVLESQSAQDASKLAQLQRSELRREALAARKSGRDDDDDGYGKRRGRETPPGDNKRRREDKLLVPPGNRGKNGARPRRDDDSRPSGLEPTYCYCNQVSFGEMVGCDGDSCKREWFHLPCIGFKNPPKGKWFCDDCSAKMKKRVKI